MKLRYTPKALFELNEILAYIMARSPRGARKVQTRMQSMINLLLEHPYAGTATNRKFRRITISPYPYLIFYQINEKELIIHAIRHMSCRRMKAP